MTKLFISSVQKLCQFLSESRETERRARCVNRISQLHRWTFFPPKESVRQPTLSHVTGNATPGCCFELFNPDTKPPTPPSARIQVTCSIEAFATGERVNANFVTKDKTLPSEHCSKCDHFLFSQNMNETRNRNWRELSHALRCLQQWSSKIFSILYFSKKNFF